MFHELGWRASINAVKDIVFNKAELYWLYASEVNNEAMTASDIDIANLDGDDDALERSINLSEI